MSRRRKGREFALQILFLGAGGADGVEEQIPRFWESQGLPPQEVREFAEELVRGVAQRREEIDAVIARCSEHWAPERMAMVDRAVLRLAAYELLFREDIPPKVTINEYIEIAKRFSTEESGAFVNGILDRIFREQGSLPPRGGAPRR